MTRSYAVVVGTRPNFVKAASFFAEARLHPEFSFFLIHTGQHFDANMSKIFFDQMGIPVPDVQLAAGNAGTYSQRLGGLIDGLHRVFADHKSDLAGVIVFGDVNSSLAGAIAAAKLGIPVIHVEAGLRSDDARMPEETNRILIDHLSERLMVSEPAAIAHLNEEGISEGIYSVGSLMAQSIELFKDLIDSDAVCDKFSLERKGFLVATIHRIENIEDPAAARKVLDVLGALSKRHTIVFPLHPGTRRRINELGISDVLGAVRVIEPLGYLEFLGLVTGSRGVITDSGGIQEETTHLGIPCATLRDNTERPVTVERGTNRLFPPSTLTEDTYESIEGHLTRTDFKSKQIPLWDAHVAERIFENL